MTSDELKKEHAFRYSERLGMMEVWGTPSAFEHNTAVEEADEVVKILRQEMGIVQKLRELRESL